MFSLTNSVLISVLLYLFHTIQDKNVVHPALNQVQPSISYFYILSQTSDKVSAESLDK